MPLCTYLINNINLLTLKLILTRYLRKHCKKDITDNNDATVILQENCLFVERVIIYTL